MIVVDGGSQDGRSRSRAIAACEPSSLAQVAAPRFRMALRHLVAMCCSFFMQTARCLPGRSTGSRKCSRRMQTSSVEIFASSSMAAQTSADGLPGSARGSGCWALLWQLGDFRPSLSLRSPRRISPDTADGGLGLCARLERFGRTCCIKDPPLVTSSRRFERRHPLGIVYGWVRIHTLFWLGVSPDRLVEIYRTQAPPAQTRTPRV